MEPWSYELAGRFEEHAFESEVLKGNALGDPHTRPLWVYLPPGYDEDEEPVPAGVATLVDLARSLMLVLEEVGS